MKDIEKNMGMLFPLMQQWGCKHLSMSFAREVLNSKKKGVEKS